MSRPAGRVVTARPMRQRLLGPLVVAGAAIAAGGCATTAAVVPLRGAPSAYSQLAGEWSGTYESRATGRTGSIRFVLVDGEDHAHGDVVMTSMVTTSLPPPYTAGPSRYQPRNETHTYLTIRFVRVAGDEIEGALDPYWEPQCDCEILTAFYGALSDGRIDGTFVSRIADAIATGEWQVTRKARRPR
jgi:hypothetical protein